MASTAIIANATKARWTIFFGLVSWRFTLGSNIAAHSPLRQEQSRIVVQQRRAEQNAIDAVEHAAVTRQQVARILHLRAALEHGFGKIAALADDADCRAKQHRLPERNLR